MDKSQRKAVFSPTDRSVLVIAPPGYGKTYTMTNRVSYLLQGGFVRSPSRILGLTFTNAAAREMLDRIRDQIGHQVDDIVSIITFHSFCYKTLRAYGNYLGINPDYSVIGNHQCEEILLSIFLKNGVKLNDDYPLSTEEVKQYNEWVNKRILHLSPDHQNREFNDLFDSIYNEYIQQLKSNNSLDFDHILLYCYELLVSFPEVLELYRATYSYILIDEFHDTNPLQFKILELLSVGHPEEKNKCSTRPLFILADKHQAIYEFQGAKPENIKIAKKTFDCIQMTLKNNHRTESENIAWLAEGFWNEAVSEAEIDTDERIELLVSANPQKEARKIFERIQEYKGPLHDVCVVSQASKRLSPIRELFDQVNNDIPYVFVPDFSSKNIEINYSDVFDSIRDITSNKRRQSRLSNIVKEICEEYREDWKKDDVLKLLINLAKQYDYRYGSLTLCEKAKEFSNDILLDINWGDMLRRNVRDKVFLSTIHGVKGLQFEQVHVCGLSNFEHIHSSICFPCDRGKNRGNYINALKEPYRTLYVAVTRAKRELFLYTSRKATNGRRRVPVCLLKQLIPFLRVEGLAPNEDIYSLLCGID